MIVLINFQNTEIDCNVVKINKKEFVISSYSDKYLKFWELINLLFQTFVIYRKIL